MRKRKNLQIIIVAFLVLGLLAMALPEAFAAPASQTQATNGESCEDGEYTLFDFFFCDPAEDEEPAAPVDNCDAFGNCFEAGTPAATPVDNCDAFGNCIDTDETPVSCQDLLNLTLLDLLACMMQMPDAGGGADEGRECNPIFGLCIWSPGYASCFWDAYYGLYICEGALYPPPGYGCYLDLWMHGGYVCPAQNGWGW